MSDRDTPLQQTLTGETISEERTCPTCGKVFDTEVGMHRHHSWIHGESLVKTTLICENCGGETEMYEHELEVRSTDFCKDCLYNADLGDAHPSSRERPQEVVERIAEAQRGKTMPDHVIEAAKEGWRDWWENDADQEGWVEHLTEISDTEMTDEIRQKISDTLEGHDVSEETRQKIRENSYPPHQLSIEVDETGHTVRSHWEAEIDKLLSEAVDAHEYEPERFDIGDRYYTPDFRVDDTIIEVKGYVWEGQAERSEMFLETHPEYTYIVVGSELPADIHIPWEERETLRGRL